MFDPRRSGWNSQLVYPSTYEQDVENPGSGGGGTVDTIARGLATDAGIAAAAALEASSDEAKNIWAAGTGASIVRVTGNTTLSFASHNNRIIQVDSAGDVVLTLPANAPAGFSFVVDQVGEGQAIFAVAGAATRVNRNSYDRTAGAAAMMSVYVRTNASGNNAVYLLSGDGAVA